MSGRRATGPAPVRRRPRSAADAIDVQQVSAAILLIGWAWLAFSWEMVVGAITAGFTGDEFPVYKVAPYLLLLAGSGLALTDARARRRLKGALQARGTTARVAKLVIGSYLVVALASAVVSGQTVISVARFVQSLIPLTAAMVWLLALGRPALSLVVAIVAAVLAHIAITLYGWGTGNTNLGFYAAGPGGRWAGILHPMALGAGAAVLFLWSLWRILLHRGVLAWGGLALATIAFWLAKPRGAAVGAAAGASFLVWEVIRGRVPVERQRPWMQVVPLMMFGAAMLVAIVWFDPLTEWFERGQDASQLSSLSGRVEMWLLLAGLALERPFLGWGPGALRLGELAQRVGEMLSFGGSAHSAFFEVLVNTGFLGLALFLIGLVAIWKLSGRASRVSTFTPLARALLVAILVDGIASAAASGFGIPWMTVCVVGVWAWQAGKARSAPPDLHSRSPAPRQ